MEENNANDPINDKRLSEAFSRFLTGYCVSKAILEDYARVVAKIEGTTEKEIKSRLQDRASEIAKEIQK